MSRQTLCRTGNQTHPLMMGQKKRLMRLTRTPSSHSQQQTHMATHGQVCVGPWTCHPQSRLGARRRRPPASPILQRRSQHRLQTSCHLGDPLRLSWV